MRIHTSNTMIAMRDSKKSSKKNMIWMRQPMTFKVASVGDIDDEGCGRHLEVDTGFGKNLLVTVHLVKVVMHTDQL